MFLRSVPARSKLAFDVLCLLTYFLLAGCSSGGNSVQPAGVTDSDITGTPEITIKPISDSTPIVIHFSGPMNTASDSYAIGGALGDEADGGVWSAGQNPDDTLTISPTGTWTTGMNQTLTIAARDSDNNPVTAITLVHDVYAGTLYFVDSAAEGDTGEGLGVVTAKRNIYSAIDAATAPATVLVNAGNYQTNSSLPAETIFLKGGVSLYGGYSPDFRKIVSAGKLEFV